MYRRYFLNAKCCEAMKEKSQGNLIDLQLAEVPRGSGVTLVGWRDRIEDRVDTEGVKSCQPFQLDLHLQFTPQTPRKESEEGAGPHNSSFSLEPTNQRSCSLSPRAPRPDACLHGSPFIWKCEAY